MNPLRLLRAKPSSQLEPLADGAILRLYRDERVVDTFRLGKNHVHVLITHPDGDWTVRESENLLTTAGRSLAHEALGQRPLKEGAFTATSATSATPSGGGLTTDQYKGWRVYAAGAAITTPIAYGNVGSNSTTVLTLDQWWNAADGTATTPASTNGYILVPSCLPRFMGITENAGGSSAAHTALAGEITTGGCARALATFAHTAGTATETLQKSYSVTASFPAVQMMGLFTASNTTAAGILVFETTFTSASVINGDTLQVTDTITISG